MQYLFPLLAVFIWAGNTVVNKLAVGIIQPAEIGFFRWLLVGLALTPFMLGPVLRNRRYILANLGKFVVLGLLGMAVYQSLAYYAAALTSATNMGIILSLMPLMSLGLASSILAHRLNAGALLGALAMLTLTLAKLRGHLSPEAEAGHLKAMRHLPAALQAVLALEPQIVAWAEAFARKDNALFLGRGLHYPIGLEGALKLKEISYIHAEAYPAGELKHGPLALVTAEMPVVVVAPNDVLLEKLKSNMQEVKARGGELYVCADGDTQIQAEPGIHVIRMPEHYGALSPILHVVPLQLLAYHTACAKGTDVDKPRNLAKSVTVE